MTTKSPVPDIYHYLDFRSYLKDRIEQLKNEGKYSTRKFAKEVGFSSPTTLGHIISGRRNVSKDGLKKIARAFKLDPRQSQFLQHIADFTQSKSAEEKNHAYQQICKFHNFRKTRVAVHAEYELFSKGYIVLLLEALGTDFRKKSTREMASRLGISPHELQKALDSLLALGLIRPNGPYYQRVEQSLETPSEMQSLNIRNFHREMIRLAETAMENVPVQKRNFGTLTMALTENEFQEIRDKVNDFLSDLAASYSGQKDAEAVYQLNVQIFPALEL